MKKIFCMGIAVLFLFISTALLPMNCQAEAFSTAEMKKMGNDAVTINLP